MALIFFILGLIMFVGLVVLHELGHFIAARRNGIEVEEFGIGFPPRGFKKMLRNGTLLTINWLPLGGFVKLKGEHDADTEKGSYGAAPLGGKVRVMLAGVLMNLIAALALFTVVALIGMPKILDTQFTVQSDTKIIKDVENKGVVKIGRVIEGSPAEKAGLKKDNRIISINGVIIDKPEKLSEVTEKNAGQKVVIEVEDFDVSNFEPSATIYSTGRRYYVKLNDTSPYLGVAPYSAEAGFEIRRSTWSAPIVAVGVSKDFTVATFKGLGTALEGLGSIIAGAVTGNSDARRAGQQEAGEQVSGPVGIFDVLYRISREGFGLVLFIVAIISLTLAIMNALPIPALDGGRLFVTLLYRARRKILKPSTEEKIHGTGFAILILLIVLVTIVDVRRTF